MVRYFAWRLALGILVLWAAFTLSFLLLYLLPGDAAAVAAAGGGEGAADPAAIEALRAELGLDAPFHEQYLAALGGALVLDFGSSVQNGIPATEVLARALPSTATLAGASLVLSVVGGVGLALVSNLVRSSWLRGILQSLPSLAIAVPTFWLGLLLLQVFSFQLGWVPAFGSTGFVGLILPALTLSIPTGAYLAQVLTRSLHETLSRPFVEQARAKGARDTRILIRHALRNAALPTLTIGGVLVGQLLAGTVVTETVFSRDGVGRMIVTAVANRDIPLVMIAVVFAAVVFVVTNLIVDALYPLIDPRLTHSTKQQRPSSKGRSTSTLTPGLAPTEPAKAAKNEVPA